MGIRYALMIGYLALALVSPLFAGKATLVNEKTREQEAAFVKTMQSFIRAEGLNREIQPSYVCQKGQEVCGRITGNLEGLLRKRPDFLPDAYNFRRAHPGSTCSYRGMSGSSHYSLHIVCYGAEVAGIHIDVRLPKGFWGNIEHDVRDVAENYFKVYALRKKNSHTSETQLARNFTKWWRSYQTAYPELAAEEIPKEAEELRNGLKLRITKASLPRDARGFQ
jgi:hypothetical protein